LAITNLDFVADPEDQGVEEDAPDDAQLELIDAFQDHPINSPEKGARIWTRPIDEAYKIIKDAVLRKRSGVWVAAASGDGKTSLIIAATQRLDLEWRGRIALVRLNYMIHQAPSARGFYVQFLKSLGVKEHKGETFALRLRVTNAFVSLASQVKRNVVYLFIDEAQQMRELELGFLKDLSNELEGEQVQLVTLLFGQDPGLSAAISDLDQKGNFALISRFANRQLRFRSFSTLEDFEDLLDAIDKKLDDNGVPYTAFFFPEAFAAGYRLKREARRFYSALQECMKGGESYGYPARQVFFCIQDFFGYEANSDSPTFEGTIETWREAIDEANMKQALKHKEKNPLSRTGTNLLPKTNQSADQTSTNSDESGRGEPEPSVSGAEEDQEGQVDQAQEMNAEGTPQVASKKRGKK
jgi:hypothetical protein